MTPSNLLQILAKNGSRATLEFDAASLTKVKWKKVGAWFGVLNFLLQGAPLLFLFVWLIDGFVDGWIWYDLIGWLIGWLVDSLIHWLVVWLVDWVIDLHPVPVYNIVHWSLTTIYIKLKSEIFDSSNQWLGHAIYITHLMGVACVPRQFTRSISWHHAYHQIMQDLHEFSLETGFPSKL